MFHYQDKAILMGGWSDMMKAELESLQNLDVIIYDAAIAINQQLMCYFHNQSAEVWELRIRSDIPIIRLLLSNHLDLDF